jgi:hypothetical protein
MNNKVKCFYYVYTIMSFDGSGAVSLGRTLATSVVVGRAAVATTVAGSTVDISTPATLTIAATTAAFGDTNITTSGDVTFGAGTVAFGAGAVTGLVGVGVVGGVGSMTSGTSYQVFTVAQNDDDTLSTHTITWNAASQKANDELVAAVAGTTTFMFAYLGANAALSQSSTNLTLASVGGTISVAWTAAKTNSTTITISAAVTFSGGDAATAYIGSSLLSADPSYTATAVVI